MKQYSIGVNCFFLKIAHKAMAEAGTDEIAQEVKVPEDTLSNCNHGSEEWPRLFIVHE